MQSDWLKTIISGSLVHSVIALWEKENLKMYLSFPKTYLIVIASPSFSFVCFVIHKSSQCPSRRLNFIIIFSLFHIIHVVLFQGAMEQILASCIGGILFALFSGQPLIILGATGPMLVFEEILFSFCQMTQLDYMPFRLWIGIWTMCFCIILVITDTSALVHYFTRFTEESFATLIALIYIYEGFKKLMEVSKKHPFNTGYIEHHYCLCKAKIPYTKPQMYPNGTWNNQTLYNNTILDVPYMECSSQGGYLEGGACSDNVFFLSVLLCLATFTIAISLKGFKTSSYFPTKVSVMEIGLNFEGLIESHVLKNPFLFTFSK